MKLLMIKLIHLVMYIKKNGINFGKVKKKPTKEIAEKKLNELRKNKRWNGGF